MWGIRFPLQGSFWWGAFPSLCRTPARHSPLPRGQPSQDCSCRNPCPSRAPALSSQQHRAPRGPALCYMCQPELPQPAAGTERLQDRFQLSFWQSPYVLMTAVGTSSDSLPLLCGRGRAGSQGSCTGDFPTQEKARRWVSSLVVSRLSVVWLNTDGAMSCHSTCSWLWTPGGIPTGQAQWPY